VFNTITHHVCVFNTVTLHVCVFTTGRCRALLTAGPASSAAWTKATPVADASIWRGPGSSNVVQPVEGASTAVGERYHPGKLWMHVLPKC